MCLPKKVPPGVRVIDPWWDSFPGGTLWLAVMFVRGSQRTAPVSPVINHSSGVLHRAPAMGYCANCSLIVIKISQYQERAMPMPSDPTPVRLALCSDAFRLSSHFECSGKY